MSLIQMASGVYVCARVRVPICLSDFVYFSEFDFAILKKTFLLLPMYALI